MSKSDTGSGLELEEGWKILHEENGVYFLGNPETKEARFHIDPEKFDIKVDENKTVKLFANDKLLYMIPGNDGQIIYRVLNCMPSPEGIDYFMIKSIIDDTKTFMYLDDGRMFEVDKIVKCTGDDTCEHCKECDVCSALHCKGHES